jgi:hypothetical protein
LRDLLRAAHTSPAARLLLACWWAPAYYQNITSDHLSSFRSPRTVQFRISEFSEANVLTWQPGIRPESPSRQWEGENRTAYFLFGSVITSRNVSVACHLPRVFKQGEAQGPSTKARRGVCAMNWITSHLVVVISR